MSIITLKGLYMKTLWRLIKWLLFLGIIASLIYGGLQFMPKPVKKRERLATVTYRDIIQRVTMAGTIVPKRATIIQAPYQGYVKKIYVQIGEKVNVGAPIVSVTQSLQNGETVFPIRAPYVGVVVAIGKTEGQFVNTGGDEKNYIVKIDDLSEMYVDVDVPEYAISQIKKGQKAIIKATALLDRTYQGVIETIFLASNQKQSGFSSRKSAMYPAKIRLINPDKALRTDMSVIVDITTHQRKHVLTLPHEYIHKEGKRYYVILADRTRKNVTLGIQNEAYAEIRSGVKAGDKIRRVDYLQAMQ